MHAQTASAGPLRTATAGTAGTAGTSTSRGRTARAVRRRDSLLTRTGVQLAAAALVPAAAVGALLVAENREDDARSVTQHAREHATSIAVRLSADVEHWREEVAVVAAAPAVREWSAQDPATTERRGELLAAVARSVRHVASADLVAV